MDKGEKVNKSKTLVEIADYSIKRLVRLPEEYKRFDNPHIYKIGISKKLEAERNRLVDEFKK
jgi:nicotinate phosphoribosyltransferase